MSTITHISAPKSRSSMAAAMLVMLCLPVWLFVGLQLARWRVKHTAEERLESQQLHTLSLPANQVIWEEANREIRWQGRLFDIKTQHRDGDMLIVTGLFDEEEEAIEQAAARLAGHSISGEKTVALWMLTAAPWLPGATLSLPNAFYLKKAYSPFGPYHISSGYRKVASPPPNGRA